MPLQGNLSIERMCELARVSRASYYRSLKEQRPAEEETEVRSAIQQIALDHRRRYGYRRITAELRRRGMAVNHKRVLRMMRRDNLLALRRRRFVVTTDSNHKFEVYLNLARRMKLTGVDQLWVADITYIRLNTEFVYLAVILDAFSRKVVGWGLDQTLGNRLTITALERAVAQRRPRPGLVHHSDDSRSSQSKNALFQSNQGAGQSIRLFAERSLVHIRPPQLKFLLCQSTSAKYLVIPVVAPQPHLS